ncbi:MAG TPA: hypothetical protein VMY76_10505 [Gemmatimonadales bacterium]|nr:hypothetical protein [Gemmatimonadales bacterium]
MYAQSTTLGILAAIAIALPATSAPSFTLHSTGAVQLRATGHEARYGIVAPAVSGHPVLTVALGAETGAGALHLTLPGDRLPAPGVYPIRSTWNETAGDTAAFHASFMAGTVEHPVGWFQGESGWVKVTGTKDGRISGTYEIATRGFLSADLADEDQRVTVRGSFEADGDSTATTIALVR